MSCAFSVQMLSSWGETSRRTTLENNELRMVNGALHDMRIYNYTVRRHFNVGNDSVVIMIKDSSVQARRKMTK